MPYLCGVVAFRKRLSDYKYMREALKLEVEAVSYTHLDVYKRQEYIGQLETEFYQMIEEEG